MRGYVGAGQDLADRPRRRCEHVLAVVDDDEHATAGQCLRDRIDDPSVALRGDAQRGGDRVGDRLRVAPGASSTSQTPSGNSPWSSEPTASASLVFPTPPAPVRVASGRDRTNAATSDTTCDRPTSVVVELGRFPRPACTLIVSVWHRRRSACRISATDKGGTPWIT